MGRASTRTRRHDTSFRPGPFGVATPLHCGADEQDAFIWCIILTGRRAVVKSGNRSISLLLKMLRDLHKIGMMFAYNLVRSDGPYEDFKRCVVS